MAAWWVIVALSIIGRGFGDESKAMPSMWTSLDWLYNTKPKCGYRQGLVRSVEERLRETIGGQEAAMDAIITAVSNWQLTKELKTGNGGPLVLAVTGPTGVGKTETAKALAESLFSESIKVNEYGDSTQPCGWLYLRGAEFSNTSEAAQGGLADVQNLLKAIVVDHLIRTEGNALIVLDEVQKVMPHVLDVLMPALEESGSLTSTQYIERNPNTDGAASLLGWLSSTITPSRVQVDCAADEDHPICKDQPPSKNSDAYSSISSHNGPRSKTRRFPTDRSMFVFISDIGSQAMVHSLVSYGSRDKLPKHHIRGLVKQALDDQWNRLGFGKFIDGVVPFLPLEAVHLGEVMRLKMRQLSRIYESKWWLLLAVDEDVFQYLTLPQFIDYESHKVVLKPKLSPGADAATEATAAAVEGIVRTKSFVKFGGRALENGPLQALQAQMVKYSKPHQPGKILHVGMLSKANILRSRVWGNKNFDQLQVYVQWCTPNRDMLDQLEQARERLPETCIDCSQRAETNRTDVLIQYDTLTRVIRLLQRNDSRISDDIAFNGKVCDTLWFGVLSA